MGDNGVRATSHIEALEARYIPEPMSGCWLWIGPMFNHGYGLFSSKFWRQAMGNDRASGRLDHP